MQSGSRRLYKGLSSCLMRWPEPNEPIDLTQNPPVRCGGLETPFSRDTWPKVLVQKDLQFVCCVDGY